MNKNKMGVRLTLIVALGAGIVATFYSAKHPGGDWVVIGIAIGIAIGVAIGVSMNNTRPK